MGRERSLDLWIFLANYFSQSKERGCYLNLFVKWMLVESPEGSMISSECSRLEVVKYDRKGEEKIGR